MVQPFKKDAVSGEVTIFLPRKKSNNHYFDKTKNKKWQPPSFHHQYLQTDLSERGCWLKRIKVAAKPDSSE